MEHPIPKRNELLRQHRIERNWRQQDIADQLETSLVTVQRWERGTHQPSTYYLTKLCTLFGKSAQELGLAEASPPLLKDETPAEGSSGAALSQRIALWTIPYVRNPHFTGREDLLAQLEQRLAPPEASQTGNIRQVALTQAQALTGLGGIGKTQTAIEYAYRARAQGRYTHTLWMTAASEEVLLSSFVALARLLPDFAAKAETDQHKLAAAIIEWLEQCEQPWLLIFDNADDLSLVQPYLPRRGNGCVLLTTRNCAVGSLATSLEVETMGVMEGTQLLLHRAQHFVNASDEEIDEAGNLVVALAQFPLALDQAGAYLEETGCSVRDYLQLYQQHRRWLLARRGRQVIGYPESVATTWSLSFERVKEANPAAAQFLFLCAFLAPDSIPEELLVEGAACWPDQLQQAVADPFTFNQLLETLLAFSLVKRWPEDHVLSIHRLVQVVQKESMPSEVQRQWAERLVRAVSSVFPRDPEKDVASWPLCQRYLEQAQACDTLIQEHQLLLPEAAEVLDRTGSYLRERVLYSLAEPLLRRGLDMREQLGPEQPSTATSLYNLAILYWRLGKYAEAEPLYQRALRIREQQLGPVHPLVATSLNNLALLYSDQGKYEQAEPLYQRALRIYEQQFGLDHQEIASPLNNLALLYFDQGKYEQAEPLYQRALRIREQQLGPVHPLVATSLNNLAGLYSDQGKYEQAELLYQRALRIYEQQLGPVHRSVAISLVNLASLYYNQGKYEQSEQLCHRSLSILEQQLGSEHFLVAFPLHWLALVSAKYGKHEQAEHLDRRALHIWEEQLGSEHAYVAYALHGLALLSAQQRRERQAEAFFQRALRIREQRLGPEHIRTADVLYDFACFQQAQGQILEAASLYRSALTIRERVYGPDHLLTIETRKRWLCCQEKADPVQ